MIAFFFTMPISRMMPISAITSRSIPNEHQRQQRTHAGRRQRREDRDRVNVALIEHSQHDVDRDECRQNQQRFVAQRGLECLGRALERGIDAQRQAEFFLGLFDRLHGLAQRCPGAKLNEIVVTGNCP